MLKGAKTIMQWFFYLTLPHFLLLLGEVSPNFGFKNVLDLTHLGLSEFLKKIMRQKKKALKLSITLRTRHGNKFIYI